jgi:hypothetical protein
MLNSISAGYIIRNSPFSGPKLARNLNLDQKKIFKSQQHYIDSQPVRNIFQRPSERPAFPNTLSPFPFRFNGAKNTRPLTNTRSKFRVSMFNAAEDRWRYSV